MHPNSPVCRKDYIDSHKPDKNGVIHITTDYPDYVPAMNFAVSDALRRRLILAFNTRAYPQNRDVLMSMLQHALRDRHPARIQIVGRLQRSR